jgi:hypothetical protein
MGAIIEAVQVNQHPEPVTHAGVVCIFCGQATSVQTSREGAFVAYAFRPDRHVSIVRCDVCGKEATYLAHEITEFGEMLGEPKGSLWFAKDSI